MNTLFGIRLLAALSGACLAAAAAAGDRSATPLSGAEVLASAELPEVRIQEARLERIAQAADPDALLGALADLESRPDLGELTRARLRYGALMRFARVPETPAARAQLRQYLGRDPELFAWHEDGVHRVAVPIFDAGAAARFALSEWNRKSWQRHASQGLASGTTQFFVDWLNAHDASGGRLSASGLVAAFEQATTDQLADWPARLEGLLGTGAPVGEVARAVALRLQDTRLATAIMRDADTLTAMRFMDELSGRHSAVIETQVLGHALARQDLASAALYRLARLPSDGARALVISQLASPAHGTSAAAALARRSTPQLVDTLTGLIRSDETMLARRRAVLALQLMPGADGRRALLSLQREAGLPHELHGQIARSLR